MWRVFKMIFRDLKQRQDCFIMVQKLIFPVREIKRKNLRSNNDVIITWPQYFDIFKYDWLAGNATTH